MGNVIAIFILLVLVGLFVFLAVRAFRARQVWIKWPGGILSSLLALVLLAVTGVALLGLYRINVAPHRYTVSDVQVAMTPENIARGERLSNICIDCHSSAGSLPLDGMDFMAEPGMPPIGTLIATNLTPGGPLAEWSDGEIIRAIREGIGDDGRPLMIMPSMAFRHMSDEDVQAVVAYLRSQPAVENKFPETKLNILAALFVGANMFPTSAQAPITTPVVAPVLGTPEYGDYLVRAYGCEDCHGENLDGNSPLGPGVNLTTVVPGWTEEQFLTFIREGVDPISGRAIDPQAMPVKAYDAAFSDDELRDMFSYLHGLERVETPGQ